ncbi:hypothetical protein H6P81_003459 [Aristolochia fimbriata]|uniref:R3H domain-containing protein 2-like n=1 Tax=Aristolochia fimbriata TaxID=158543 RepID=A0AAV7FFW5_ARIFI|nr:hypothetical protein H6P81_003459 [Aristolochia fimbriata]
MEGSVEDAGAPDSWEMADLDDSMSRLMVSSKKSISSSSNFRPSDLIEELPLKPADSSSSSPSSSLPASSTPTSQLASISSGEDLLNQVDQFLREALQNPRERLSVLRMEQDVLKFIHDPAQQQMEFPQLPTSYLRLAAHRVAQHYYLQSMVVSDPTVPDGSGSRILVRKTSECRLPLIRLADIPVNLPQEDNNAVLKVAIKQRPQKRAQMVHSANASSSNASFAKSVEERKEEYNKARARIFSSSSNISGPQGVKAEGGDLQINTTDSLSQIASLPSPKLDDKSVFEGHEIIHGSRILSDSSTMGSSRSGRSRTEKEPITTRYRPNNRVAIFRDREVDKKDPDYDRSYDRYMQRFDPGFGFSGGPYTIQPLYAPALNYNTEFPQLGSASHRPQMAPIEPRPIPQPHLRGPWGATTNAPSPIGYGPPDNLMAPPPPFNPGHVGAHSTSAIYHLHSSQYPCPRPGITYVHPHEHVHQPFPQSLQQQHEANFGIRVEEVWNWPQRPVVPPVPSSLVPQLLLATSYKGAATSIEPRKLGFCSFEVLIQLPVGIGDKHNSNRNRHADS